MFKTGWRVSCLAALEKRRNCLDIAAAQAKGEVILRQSFLGIRPGLARDGAVGAMFQSKPSDRV